MVEVMVNSYSDVWRISYERGETTSPAKSFLCHSKRDKPVVRRIAADLVKEGIDVWLDEWEIYVGNSISAKIREGLGSADSLLWLYSNRYWLQKGLYANLIQL
jgi:hypothetical protein